MSEWEYLPGEPGHPGSTQYTIAELAQKPERRAEALEIIATSLAHRIALLVDPYLADDGFNENWQPPADYQLKADKKQLQEDPRAYLKNAQMGFELGTVENHLFDSMSDEEITVVVDQAFEQAGFDRGFNRITKQ